jgi:hypothetical protein
LKKETDNEALILAKFHKKEADLIFTLTNTGLIRMNDLRVSIALDREDVT